MRERCLRLSGGEGGSAPVARIMWAYLLRAILYFLLGVTLLRLFRGTRRPPRPVPPPPARRSIPELDPRDIIDATSHPIGEPGERPR